MAYSEAQGRANRKYRAKAYDRIELNLKRGKRDLIQNAAKSAGESINAYIDRAIEMRMEAEKTDTDITASATDIGKAGQA